MRMFFAKLFLRIGVAIMPRDVRELVRDMIMYHVPGALTE